MGRIRYGKRQKRSTKGYKLEQNHAAGGEGAQGGSHKNVPDAREASGSQDPTGMTLPKMPIKGEAEHRNFLMFVFFY